MILGDGAGGAVQLGEDGFLVLLTVGDGNQPVRHGGGREGRGEGGGSGKKGREGKCAARRRRWETQGEVREWAGGERV